MDFSIPLSQGSNLSYLRKNNTEIPSKDANWDGENISSEEAVATKNFLYSFQDWTVSVVSPLVAPERKVFTVVVLNESVGFQWAGLVDAYGKIVRMGSLLQATAVAPTATVNATKTATSPLPSATPTDTSTPTPALVACNDATFLEDITIPDGTTFTPNTRFLKVWRLRDVGTCIWTSDYDLVFAGGNRLSAQRSVPLTETVRPGESVELGAYMIAPRTPGNYQGFWTLRNANGRLFGIGDSADDSFWVSIKVVGNTSGYYYDFALNYCSAIWRSATGRLPCGDISTPRDGSVQFKISSNFENRHENEATIQVHPNEARDGWIEGSYPAVSIQDGDRFKCWVGCMAGYDLCNVTFYLSYVGEDNHIYTLQTWHEVYDEEVTVIDMDLGGLAGQSVQFILGMEAKSANVRSAQGFWFVPHIER